MNTKLANQNRSVSFPKLMLIGVYVLVALSSKSHAQLLFDSDFNSGSIYAVPISGGAPSTFASGLVSPSGMAFDSGGNLFVAGANSGTITEFTSGGGPSTFASGVGVPRGLAFNSAGDLFAADEATGSIYQFSPSGSQSLFASGLSLPVGLAFNNAGNLFVADSGSGNIYKYTPSGTRTLFASGLTVPRGLAFNSTGNLFVSDGSGNIDEFTPTGAESIFVSGLNTPIGLAFDSSDDLFEADYGSGMINEFRAVGGPPVVVETGLTGPDSLAIQPVPEPATWTMIAMGIVGLVICRGRRNAGWPSTQAKGNQKNG